MYADNAGAPGVHDHVAEKGIQFGGACYTTIWIIVIAENPPVAPWIDTDGRVGICGEKHFVCVHVGFDVKGLGGRFED